MRPILTRELRNLGVGINSLQVHSNTQEDNPSDQESQEGITSMQDQELQVPQEDLENQEFQENSKVLQTMATPVLATAINPFHSDLDITTEIGKKFWTTATKGLDESLKYNGDKKEILTFLRNIERQGEKFGFASVG